MRKNLLFYALPFAIALLTGCIQTAIYSEAAYNETVALKQESLELMSKATDSYTTHEAEVADLLQRLDIAYANAQERANNGITVEQWKLMIDENSNLVTGFFARWKSEETLSTFFINEAKNNISKAFDTITDFEKAKKK